MRVTHSPSSPVNGRKTSTPMRLKQVWNKASPVTGSCSWSTHKATKRSSKGNTKMAKMPVIQLNNTWLRATRFLTADPPKAPNITLKVVPILAPMINSAAEDTSAIPALTDARMMASDAELDWVIAVSASPNTTNKAGCRPANCSAPTLSV